MITRDDLPETPDWWYVPTCTCRACESTPYEDAETHLVRGDN